MNPYSIASGTNYDPNVGLVVAGGIELGRPHLSFTPEVRYTRWSDRFLNVGIRNMGFLGFRTYLSNDSQVDVMLGIGWR